jgi:hypothetical protein
LATDSRLDHLWEVVKLLRRLPTGLFWLFLKQDDNADKFRFWCESGGSPGAPWGWENLDLCLPCPSLSPFLETFLQESTRLGAGADNAPCA